jgi:serine/threonine protein kinase
MWSLGMMLYQCLAGHLPFWRTPGDARSPFLIMSSILGDEVLFEGPAWSKVSPDAISFLQGLLDRDYNTRFSAREALAHPWLLQQCSLQACQVVWD